MFRFRDRWQTSLGPLYRDHVIPSSTDALLALLESRDRDLEDYLNGGTPWIEMGLTGTGWSNYGFGWAPAAYRKVGDTVQIRGLIAGGSVGNVIAVMPAGYRPTVNQIMPGSVDYGSGYQHARLDILTAGTFVAYWNGGAAGYLSINCSYSVTP